MIQNTCQIYYLDKDLSKQFSCQLYDTEKLNLAIEFWNSIFIYIFLFACMFVCRFCLNTKLLEFICSSIFSSQIKRYLHTAVWHNIHNILKYPDNENQKP